MKTVLLLPDGQELSSGVPGTNAIRSLRITQSVCPETELSFGGCCAAMLEAEVILYTPQTGLTAGACVRAFREDASGQRQPLGVFLLEKPERRGNILTLTAYDRVSLLDKDLTAWFQSLDRWPYSLRELAGLVCEACGLEAPAGDLPNGSLSVEKFSLSQVTGRGLLGWIVQAAGCFCRADPLGSLEIGWIRPLCDYRLGPMTGSGVHTVRNHSGVLQLSRPMECVSRGGSLWLAENLPVDQGALALSDSSWQQLYYYENTLRQADFSVAPVTGVQIRWEEKDVGVRWPEDAAGNLYRITANPILQSCDRPLEAARVLYERLRDIVYTPCQVTIPQGVDIAPGTMVPVVDSQGDIFWTCVMKRTLAGGRQTLESTGSPLRSNQDPGRVYSQLRGKVLRLETDVEGLRVENAREDADLASLRLQVEGITAQVQKEQAELGNMLSRLELTAQGLQLQLESQATPQSVKTATGYSFDEQGLRICKSGQEMENLLDNRGMYISRGGQQLLRVDNRGVMARDVAVENYLLLGAHARLEDYGTGRTACFYIGG